MTTSFTHDITDVRRAALSLISEGSNRALVMNDGVDCQNPKTINFVLRALFETDEPTGLRREIIESLCSSSIPFRFHIDIVSAARDYVVASMNKSGTMSAEALDILRQIVVHVQEAEANSRAYSTEGKTNPAAVFWPDPTYEKAPRDIYEEIPWAKTYGFIDKSTPISSAGSCFAMEIAHRLQADGFNYLVTERYSNVARDTTGYSDASAAWGIMFNIPSLRQLVEKSFGERQLPKLVWHAGPHDYRDPFREDVIFSSVEDYEAKYDAHLRACREALTRCEVFVATFGLNEVWELKQDGSVFSRAPWGISPFLVRRRVLTVQENIDNLQAMLDIWRVYNPRVKLIVTVSPVPFHATFRGEDTHAIAANSHAKSVLRVAAEEFASRNRDVYLFPSFETVLYCTRNPWAPDQRHVSREAVNNVMRLFEKMFLKSS